MMIISCNHCNKEVTLPNECIANIKRQSQFPSAIIQFFSDHYHPEAIALKTPPSMRFKLNGKQFNG